MSQTKAQLLDNIKDNVQLDAQKALRFADSDSSHYVAFRAPGTVSSNVTWTLPAADGSANYVLATDGSGTLSWIADPAGQWVTSGSNIYFTGGNVGIGDSSPSNPLSVTGASAFNGDVQFTGANYNVTWDKSADDLIFNDNAKAAFGTGSDLQIYYTGSSGWVYQSESGNDVSLGANGGNVWLRTGASANDDAIKCVNDGAVELYYDNSKKAETSSSGLIVSGNSTATSKFRGNDNVKLSLGDGEDIQVWHDGSHSNIKNTTGDLKIDSDNIKIRDGDGGDVHLKCLHDGAVELYYNNSKKIETQNDGVTVSGWVYIPDSDGSNNMVRLGNGADLQIYHNGSHSFIHQDGTGSLYILADTFRLNNEANTENIIAGNADGAVELYYNGSKKFETSSFGAQWFGDLKANDNQVFKVGTGNDLQIYHNGTHSYIDDAGTGGLLLRSNNFHVTNAAGTESIIHTTEDGAVDLYYDNSKKFETNSTGCKTWGSHIFTNGGSVTGGDLSFADNSKAKFGDGNDLQIYHNGTNSVIENNVGTLVVKPEGLMRIQDLSSSEVRADFNNNGSVDLYYDGAKKLATYDQGIKLYGDEGESAGIYLIADEGDDDGDTWRINCNHDDQDITFANDTSGSLSDIYTFRKNGNLVINKGISDIGSGGVTGTEVYGGYYIMQVRENNTACYFGRNSGHGTIVNYLYDGGSVGSIASNGNNLPSDRDYKKDITDLTLGLNLVNKLKPISYRYKHLDNDNDPVMYGLIAQDLEQSLLDCSVAKNSTSLLQFDDTPDPAVKHKSKYNLSYERLIPILINAVKELSTEVNTLKTKVAALESA